MDAVYRLHIYGGDNIIEEEQFFEEIPDAIESVEGRVSENAGNWKFSADGMELADANPPGVENVVIHKITKLHPANVTPGKEVRSEPVYTPTVADEI